MHSRGEIEDDTVVTYDRNLEVWVGPAGVVVGQLLGNISSMCSGYDNVSGRRCRGHLEELVECFVQIGRVLVTQDYQFGSLYQKSI
jgi:hypothetical protein